MNFDRNINNVKQTLLSRLQYCISISGIEYILLVTVPDLCRLLIGPLPRVLCKMNVFFRFSIFYQALTFANATMITRYIFLFVAKNPAAVNENFWSVFVSLWTVFQSVIVQAVISFIPTKEPVYFYICAGCRPPDTPYKIVKNIHILVMSGVSLLVHTIVPLRIAVFKGREYVYGQNREGSWNRIASSDADLKDILYNMFNFGLFMTTFLFYDFVNRIPIDKLHEYPNYLVEFFLRYWWSTLTFFFMALGFCFKHPDAMRQFINKVVNRTPTFSEN